MNDIALSSFGEDVVASVQCAAKSTAPVLILGETGCGKTVAARLIHALSARADKPFVRADCGSLPEHLFEKDMLGYESGASDDATASHPGLLEAVNGGTLFLDEVAELPLAVQPKLRSLLDDGTVQRIGSSLRVAVDARVLAASNRNLGEMARTGQFPADLFHRLALLQIVLPPLRARLSYIPDLARQLLPIIVADHWPEASAAPKLHGETVGRLQDYSWPGNIRELIHALTFAVVFHPSAVILAEHLPPEIGNPADERKAHSDTFVSRPRYAAPHDIKVERSTVLYALRECQGNRTLAARSLGMSRATLWSKLRQFGVGDV